MRMQAKATTLTVCTLGVVLIGGGLALNYVGAGLLFGAAVLAGLLLGNVLPTLLLRCPHCRALATQTQRGFVPWTGDRCRRCGKEY